MKILIGYITPQEAEQAKKRDRKSHTYISPHKTAWANIPVYVVEEKKQGGRDRYDTGVLI